MVKRKVLLTSASRCLRNIRDEARFVRHGFTMFVNGFGGGVMWSGLKLVVLDLLLLLLVFTVAAAVAALYAAVGTGVAWLGYKLLVLAKIKLGFNAKLIFTALFVLISVYELIYLHIRELRRPKPRVL